ncbi:hypothetical protein H9P43_002514 [Blastocladiella emersonii ATCC 22665]|nr:hypothetical protein H9P43_002514 [Blastocladiella emersonii ATCC 22665]
MQSSTLERIPAELLASIAAACDNNIGALARTCRALYTNCTPLLYAAPRITSARKLALYVRTITEDAGLDALGRLDGTQFVDEDLDRTRVAADVAPGRPRFRLLAHLRTFSLASLVGRWETLPRVFVDIERLARAVEAARRLAPAPPTDNDDDAMDTSPDTPPPFAHINLATFAQVWDLNTTDNLHDSTLQAVARGASTQLRRIDLEGCTRITQSGLHALFHYCRGIEECRLSAGPDVSDEALRWLAARCPRLCVLDVAGAEDVTEAGVRAVIEGCARLAELDVRGCYNVVLPAEEVAMLKAKRNLVVLQGHLESGDEGSGDDEGSVGSDAMSVVSSEPLNDDDDEDDPMDSDASDSDSDEIDQDALADAWEDAWMASSGYEPQPNFAQLLMPGFFGDGRDSDDDSSDEWSDEHDEEV